MRSRLAVLTLISLAGSLGALAQNAPQSPDSPTKRVDELFQNMDTTVSPGCALAVMKDSRIIYERGYGMADLDHNIPITPKTVFHVASMSKQFTAASVLMLAQEGKLSLDDPVRKYIPELPDFGTTGHRSPCLSITPSGLRDQWDRPGARGLAVFPSTLITRTTTCFPWSCGKRTLNFTPGSEAPRTATPAIPSLAQHRENSERSIVARLHHRAHASSRST